MRFWCSFQCGLYILWSQITLKSHQSSAGTFYKIALHWWEWAPLKLFPWPREHLNPLFKLRLKMGTGPSTTLGWISMGPDLGNYEIMFQECSGGGNYGNYKVLLWWYIIPSRLTHTLADSSANCFRGLPELWTFFHIWWSCPIAQNLWQKMLQILCALFRPAPALDFPEALLNCKHEGLSKSQFLLITHVLTAGKQVIACAWLTPCIPISEVKTCIGY